MANEFIQLRFCLAQTSSYGTGYGQSEGKVLVCFIGGDGKEKVWCILKDHWKNMRDRFGPSKHLRKHWLLVMLISLKQSHDAANPTHNSVP